MEVEKVQIIDGKRISQEIKDELKTKVEEYRKEGREAALAVIQVGNDPASSEIGRAHV